jgi:phosphoribosylaminoimidazole-succinocarboxamide synthase
MTPSTKGILKDIPNVPEADDVNVTREDLINNYQAFNFRNTDDINYYEKLLADGFTVISDELAKLDQIFVDTKFEFGYVTDTSGNEKLIYMDEVGTPDSSRIWDGAAYRDGQIIENSKEDFRQVLLNYFPDPDILLNKERMPERFALAADNALPQDILMQISKIYTGIAEKITGKPITLSQDPKTEIIDILRSEYQLIN